ncbi:MAG: Cytosolic iron-sulfur protein assembly protein [Vezdaea acicularis]|nr:MAG: Cytosolic iron-sulfur protein assembly protein [Vezdaea acicularis]
MVELKPLSTLTPASLSRAWLSAPHPTLPLIATCSSDRQVRIYSLQNFKLHSTVEGGHKRSIRSCAWKPNTKGESVLATGSFDASAGIWRRYDDNQSGVIRDSGNEDGQGFDHGENHEDDDEWRFAVVLDGHESEIKSVSWSAGGQYLATCSRDKSVWIWEEIDVDDFETIAVLQDHEADVKCVCWHPEEELLASSSYDDTVRLYKEDMEDWTCVSVMKGHESTVWAIDFEPLTPALNESKELSEKQLAHQERRRRSGPRIASASADSTIRIWRRVFKEGLEPSTAKTRIPSILRTSSAEEEWICEALLPKKFEREVYSVAWSKKSGRIVASGGDGRIVVFEEQWHTKAAEQDSDTIMTETETEAETGTEDGRRESSNHTETEWIILAEFEGAHGVFEVNHVCWASRWDKGRERDGEEIIISTGDDGEVRIWTLEERHHF